MTEKMNVECGQFATAFEEDSNVAHKGYVVNNKVFFEKEVADEIAKIHTYSDASMDMKVWYDEDKDCFVCRDDVNFADGYHDVFEACDLETEDGIKHVYDFSAWSWYRA